MLVEQVGPVVQAEQQLRTGDRDQSERVVRGIASPQLGDLQSGARLVADLHRVVLEHEIGVEQLAGTGQLVHLGQAEVLAGRHLGLLPQQVAKQAGDRCPGTQPQPDRQGVDEQAQHRLDTGEFGGTAGHGDAEHHVRAPGQLPEHNAPRQLEQGVQGDLLRPGERGQPREEASGQADRELIGYS